VEAHVAVEPRAALPDSEAVAKAAWTVGNDFSDGTGSVVREFVRQPVEHYGTNRLQ
jgi:hypothetical protein